MLSLADCSRKRRYPTEWEAEQVAEYQMSLNPGLILRVYYCAACGSYHLTHKPRRF
jgi:hypothetical protein